MNKLLTVGCLTLSLSVFAQDFVVKDGQTIDALISSENLNRIYLKDDRIESIKALEGQFQSQHDAQTGELYLKPNLAYQEKPINLFITSEQGFSYALTLKPGSKTPQTIMLDNLQAYSIDEKINAQNEIHALLNQMYMGIGNDEFVRQVIDVEGKSIIRDEIAISHQTNFWGQDYVGEVLLVTNDSDKTITLHEEDVADNNTIALVLLSHELEPEQYTVAYRVKRHA
ncbi:MAG: type-F conjugative transfer system secretin TraK [Legionellales bacterium]|jgi:type-F conjugative transfer system secretin TraK